MSVFTTCMKAYIVILSMLFVFGCPPQKALANTQTLTIALEDFPTHFNPALMSGPLVFNLGSQLFAGLTRLDSAGVPTPYLAKKWDVSADKKNYTFFLHENAFFHDDTPIKASDIIFSVQTSKKYHPFHPFLENISSVSAIDEHTVVFSLKSPMPSLPSLLIPILVPILPEHIYGGGIPLPENPANINVIGSGPFFLESFKEGEFIHLAKNPRFFLSNKPRLDRIIYKIFLDHDEKLYSLSTGESNIAFIFSRQEVDKFLSMYPKSAINIDKTNNIYPYLLVTYNMRKEIFADKRVRQAFSLGINRTVLAQLIQENNVYPMYGPLPKGSPFFTAVDEEYNIEKANKLLDEAGYLRNENGKRFDIVLDYQNYPLNIDLLRWLQNEFSSKLGIEIRTRKVNSLMKGIKNVEEGDFDMLLDELFAWHDPLVGTHRVYSEKNHDKGIIWSNIGKYFNPKAENLMDAATIEIDARKRHYLYSQLQRILADDYAALWLITNNYYLLSNKHIKNTSSLSFGIMSPFIDIFKAVE